MFICSLGVYHTLGADGIQYTTRKLGYFDSQNCSMAHTRETYHWNSVQENLET